MNLPAFPFNSQSLPIAVAEIFLLLCLAASVGWFAARLIIKRRMHNLRNQIEEKKFELDQFRMLTKSPIDQPVATNASKTVYPETSPDHAPDDLKIIEGIGPKIEELLNKEGIHTFEQLSETSIIRIVGILKKAGPRYQIHDPSSWPKQAGFAKDQEWEELDKLKLLLISGEEH
jgi:predicted flap endonuclease-1-like 5' DNA nuclease